MSVVVDVLTSRPFIETVLVLVVTAALTGLLVPVVKSRMDDRRLREQQLFEARLARQGKIIESQAALLEGLAETLWEFRKLMLEVAFLRVERPRAQYRDALATYEDKAWDLFAAFRTRISEARRLTSPDTHRKLRDLYYKTLIPLDKRLYELLDMDEARGEGRGDAAADAAWQEFYAYLFGEITDTIDGVLNGVAEELRLSERGLG